MYGAAGSQSFDCSGFTMYVYKHFGYSLAHSATAQSKVGTYVAKENLQPGDKLPNETILSERLNAGRSSVREAMKLLASRNIVTIRQGSGTYISSSPGMVDLVYNRKRI